MSAVRPTAGGTSPVLRVARSTDDLEALIPFYCTGLGFDILYRFYEHAGFDGLILGKAGAPYHLEFTRSATHKASRAPSTENLLVLYLPDESEWCAAFARMTKAGFGDVAPANPYWAERGVTFEDPDGYRIVLQNAAWSL